MKLTPIILAAGHGTRMRSKLPKMLHPLAGKPLVMHALDAVASLGGEKPVVVVGHGEDAVRQAVGDVARFAVQEKQLGTAHAVLAAEELVAQGEPGLVLVTYADMPLIRPETLSRLVAMQRQNPGPMSMVTVMLDDPHGFGRVIRNPDGSVAAVVEEAVATPEQLSIRELNVSMFCFRSEWLWPALKRIHVSPKGEYYLTDIVEVAARDGLRVEAFCSDDPDEMVGVNTRVHLSEAEGILRRRINERWMLAGVTMIDPASSYIGLEVVLGQDTVIWPNTYLRGKTVIGSDCNIGPDTIIEDCQIGNNCKVLASVLESSTLEDDVRMGPFCHLRPRAYLSRGVKMGNFGEVKGSTLGPGVHMGHFSYVGDAKIGAHTNIGAGTITCNYDGKNKFKTEIGEDVFLGSDTLLVAPVKLGARARTGAGAVVTHDVPEDVTVVGVPAKPFQTAKQQDEQA
jgi:bifunctional UDP-N-acetylglucosamine pyrophosphorylase/glucosamine-1-phosphate N-acetyltransferase